MTDRSVQRRLAVVRQAANAASEYLLGAMWEQHAVSAKGSYDLSLTADTEAGKRIAALIEPAFPGEFILEEDGPEDDQKSEWLWIVDPLDGTVNYHHRLPWFCVSVACYHRTTESVHPLWRYGRPVASCVVAPVWNQEFWAAEGEGAWCGSRRLKVSNDSLASSLISFSRGSRHDDQHFMRGLLEHMGGLARKTRSHGAAALDLAFVAQGSLGAHLQRSLQSWDVAAGAQLVLEAGGIFEADAAEGGLHVLAAGPSIARELTGPFRGRQRSEHPCE